MPYVSHEVKRNETLAMIDKQYGVSSVVIAKINDIQGNKVTSGQILKIPQMSEELS